MCLDCGCVELYSYCVDFTLTLLMTHFDQNFLKLGWRFKNFFGWKFQGWKLGCARSLFCFSNEFFFQSKLSTLLSVLSVVENCFIPTSKNKILYLIYNFRTNLKQVRIMDVALLLSKANESLEWVTKLETIVTCVRWDSAYKI